MAITKLPGFVDEVWVCDQCEAEWDAAAPPQLHPPEECQKWRAEMEAEKAQRERERAKREAQRERDRAEGAARRKRALADWRAKWEAEAPAREQREREEERQERARLVKAAEDVVPPRFRGARLGDFEGWRRWREAGGRADGLWRFAAEAEVKDGRLDYPGGRCWFLRGPRGVGKTRRAAAVAIELGLRGVEVRFMTAAQLLEDTKAAYRRDAEGRTSRMPGICWYSLTVLDDLGAERDSRWARSTLTDWLSAAYDDKAALIITSNLDLAGVAGRYGDRVASRLAEMMVFVPVHGPDRRLARLRVMEEAS